MSYEADREERFSRAEVALEEYLARCESGATISFREWCGQHEGIAEELRLLHAECQQFDAQAVRRDSGLEPTEWIAESTSSPRPPLIEFLATRANRYLDYEFQGPIGRGGMGEVVSVHDQVLQRDLAMKVIRLDESPAAAHGPRVDPSRLARFLEEAQITSQLDHPGIVPVHELGVDPEGRAYFTMKRVEGRDLGAVFRMARKRESGWTRSKALNALIRVCEAVSYAHTRGVIHRDLKPANVMVGQFGEVYVMDWGLAKPRPDSPSRPSTKAIATHRARAPSEASGPTAFTQHGDVVGTPAYMSPEQARGEIEVVDERSDVFALGAMLYELLSGHRPYSDVHESATPLQVRELVIERPPTSLSRLDASAEPELVAICEQAMQRNPSDRYHTVEALRSDLEAFVEQRVVRAYASGAWAEIQKWLKRNQLVAALCTVSVLSIGALLGAYFTKRAEGVVLHARAQVLADKKELDALKREIAVLWPADTAHVPAMEEWLRRADALIGKLPDYERATLRASGESEAGSNEVLAAEPAQLSPAELVARSDSDALESLIAGLRAFRREQFKASSKWNEASSAKCIQPRLEQARAMASRTMTSPEARRAWAEAMDSIADRARCPMYAGLHLRATEGLLPIGQDPDSGLWEFADVATGTPPRRNSDGLLELEPENGIVFVLVPPGACWIGAQSVDPRLENYDELANANEGPVQRVQFDPFLISKYELTQEQWYRVMGSRPSHSYGTHDFPAPFWSPKLHPVEGVSWDDCQKALRRIGLEFPTEAQWEYAARAGSQTPWPGVVSGVQLRDAGNMFDTSVGIYSKGLKEVALPIPKGWLEPEEWNDGHPLHAPVDCFKANAFGLHGVVGNVMEWCKECYGTYEHPARDGDGERQAGANKGHVVRGGCFLLPSPFARAAFRFPFGDQVNIDFVGLRPARPCNVEK